MFNVASRTRPLTALTDLVKSQVLLSNNRLCILDVKIGFAIVAKSLVLRLRVT